MSARTYAEFDPQVRGTPLPGLVVRASRLSDVEGLARVDIEVHDRGPMDTLIPLISTELEKIASGKLQRYSCVATLGGEVVGYGRCGVRDDSAVHEMFTGWALTGVNVVPRWRRRHIARELTLHRLEWLRGRTDRVFSWTASDNEVSKALHEAMGFALVADDMLLPPDAAERGWVYELRFTG